MFFIEHHGEKINLGTKDIFTFCPDCGRKHRIDLAEVSDGDLNESFVRCTACSRKYITALKKGKIQPAEDGVFVNYPGCKTIQIDC